MTMLKFWVVCLGLALIQPVYAEEASHEGAAIEMSAEEQRAAGIAIGTVAPRALNETLRIPGEVVINAYRSVLVTPRITAQVVARHAKLGDYRHGLADAARLERAFDLANCPWR